MNWKNFCKRILQEIMKKNNTWNIRHLVDDSFVPSSKRPSVLHCKLTDFNTFRVLLEINGILNVLVITAKLACRNLSERSAILGPLWPWSVHQKTVYTLLLTYNVMYVHYLRMFLYWSSIYKLDSSSVFLLKFCMLITILPNFLLDFLVNLMIFT